MKTKKVSMGEQARLMIANLIEKHKLTYDKLKMMLPKSIVPGYGVIINEAIAKAKSEAHTRYLVKKDEVLITADKKKICVTNQFTKDRFILFKRFVKLAEKNL